MRRKRLLDGDMKVVNQCLMCSLDMGEGITNRQLCGKYRCYNEDLVTDFDDSIEILNNTKEEKEEEEEEEEEEEDVLDRFIDSEEFEALWRDNIYQSWNSLPIVEIFFVKNTTNTDDIEITNN